MHEAMPPADDFHEELARRNKERELLRVWEELMQKYFLPRKGVRRLVPLVRLRQMLESQDPELRFEHLTPDENPRAWEVVQMHKRQILQAELEGDWRFLREVSDATKLLKTGHALRPFYDIDYALLAWRLLYGELGNTPGQDQLREYVDTLRKRDGKPKVGNRRWGEVLKKLTPLLSRE
jgi:hypothetical protein